MDINYYLATLYCHARQAFGDNITITLDASDYTRIKFTIRHSLSALDAATCMDQFLRIHTIDVPGIIVSMEWREESDVRD